MTVFLEKKLADNKKSTRIINVDICCETAVFRHSRKNKDKKSLTKKISITKEL